MKIVIAEPPMIREIRRVFPNAGYGVLYAYGDTIYNPSDVHVPPALVAHEAVHGARQENISGTPDLWWRQYLDDPQFRYDEELVAHAAEYMHQRTLDRNRDAMLLISTGRRLSAPLYSYGAAQPTLQKAMADLKKAVSKYEVFKP